MEKLEKTIFNHIKKSNTTIGQLANSIKRILKRSMPKRKELGKNRFKTMELFQNDLNMFNDGKTYGFNEAIEEILKIINNL